MLRGVGNLKLGFRMGVLRSVTVMVCVGLSVTAAGAATHSTRRAAVLSAWELAQRERQQFEAQAEGARTRVGYERVLDAYRAVYHDNPADAHAAQAVNAVAELLTEEGRALDDEKSLRAAIGQYEFLRTQYPASGLRGAALLAEAKIEAADLDEPGVAKKKLQQLLKEAPRGESARAAREELAGLTERAATGKRVVRVAVPAVPIVQPEERSVASAADKPVVQRTAASTEPRGALAQVTGIRHWSTATYTRVAIDLGNDMNSAVTFEAARVPNPDRIYFDLHGAKLGAELVGKSFNVTDDGFLKRIRAAQAGGDVTRVVLDVNDVTEYSAFLLPNPYRLIIDIHGGRSAGAETPRPVEKTEAAAVPVAAGAGRQASAAANVSGLPAMAPTDGGEAVRASTSTETAASNSGVSAPRVGVVSRPTAARPVPNTVAVAKEGTTREVAAVSETPGRIDATSAPTSRPIATTVTLGTARTRCGRLSRCGRRRRRRMARRAWCGRWA